MGISGAAFIALLASGATTGAEELPADGILAIEAIEGPLPILESGGRVRFRYPTPDDDLPPMRVILSRNRYWVEDGHLDVVIQLNNEADLNGTVAARIRDSADAILAEFDFSPPPAPAFIFFPLIPPALAPGDSATLDVELTRDGVAQAKISTPFRLESFDSGVEAVGSIPIYINNPDAVYADNLPFSVGIPLPRGLVDSTAQLILQDESGTIIPAQIDARARWSKFGSLKWIMLDFSADLEGSPRTFFLHYSPSSRGKEPTPSHASPKKGPVPFWAEQEAGHLPSISTDFVRFDDGLWFNADGAGDFRRILTAEALAGAYVEHEDGRVYRPDGAEPFVVEENGSEKVVLRREGWYREADGGQFCRYITRYILYRDSPLVRIFHTWIFTGDGNRDRIAGMGWKFPFAGAATGKQFLSAFGADHQWLDGDYLVQYSPDAFFVSKGRLEDEFPQGRAPGVARMDIAGATVFFGSRDFWQNYPSELEFTEDAFSFHNWPRHNRPATVSYSAEDLSEEELNRNTIRLLFAHQGEVLDFRLPDEFGENPIRGEVSRGNEEASSHWDWHQPESANAQGISRTEEFWLWLTPAAEPPDDAVPLLQALNDETLRATVDPKWVAASGAFYKMHPLDVENYPEEERAFHLTARTPALWQERLGTYGMWIYGDVATWGMNLGNQTASLYRTFRSRHHGWPYSWLPFARSGDPELLKYADAATRQVIDAAYCHFVSPEVDQLAGPNRARRIGIWPRSLVPWTGRYNPSSRCYESKVEYLLHSWYLTGYHRAHELMQSWMEQTRIEETLSRRGIVAAGGRPSIRDNVTLFKSYLDTWEATFEPWFLVASHVFAQGNIDAHAMGIFDGHFWVPSIRDYHIFSADDRILDLYFEYAQAWGAPSNASWSGTGGPMIESNAYAWEITGDPYYLRRVENFVDVPTKAVFDGPGPDYLQGLYTRGSSHAIFTGFYLSLFPYAMATIHEAGQRSEPIPQPIFLNSARDMRSGTTLPFGVPIIAVLKTDVKEPVPIRLSTSSRGRDSTGTVTITAPSGEVIEQSPLTGNATVTTAIPGEAPSGVYHVAIEFSHNTSLEIPLTPVDHPEVILQDTGHSPFTSRPESSFWFKVPADTGEFRVEIPITGPTRRLGIWRPDGSPAWDLSYHPGSHDGPELEIITLKPTPAEQNKLWRITQFSSSTGFTVSPPVPQIFSTSPSRWFDPEGK